MNDKPIIFYAVFRNSWGSVRDVAVTRETDNSFFYEDGRRGETRMNKPGGVVRCATFEASREARKRMMDLTSAHGAQKAEMSNRHYDEWRALVASLNDQEAGQ